jgi:hypothetical protein
MSSTAAREVTIASAQSARGASLRRWRAGPVPWMLPAIIVLGLFYLYPVFDVLRLSFTDATLIGNHENYTLSSIVSTLTSSRLPGVLLATLIFVGGSVVGQQILGLIIALVVNGVRNAIFWEQRCCGRRRLSHGSYPASLGELCGRCYSARRRSALSTAFSAFFR